MNEKIETNKVKIQQSKNIAEQIAELLEAEGATFDVAESALRQAERIIRANTYVKANPLPRQ